MKAVTVGTAALALFAVSLFVGAGPRAAAQDAEESKPRIDVVFVLDTTGSMSGLIAGAKAKVWTIVNAMVKTDPAPQIRVGLVGYRDRGDAYVTKITELTDDLDGVYADLMGYQADGGGDGPESVNQALNEAVSKMSWSEGKKVYKVIFLVGDAPPHMDYEQDVSYVDSCKAAATNDIVVNTIQCGSMSGTEKVWRDIAARGEGRYFRVEQDGGAVVTNTPFDAKLAELSAKLEATRVYYGTATEREVLKRRDAELDEVRAEAPAAAIADRAEFLALEAGGKAFGRGKELVSDLADGKVKLEDVKESELPEELRKMNAEERAAHLAKVAKEREELKAGIAELAKQRDEYVRKELEKTPEGAKGTSFDRLVIQAAREQAHERGIEYKDAEK